MSSCLITLGFESVCDNYTILLKIYNLCHRHFIVQIFYYNLFKISAAEKTELQEKLAASANKAAGTIETMDYFKVRTFYAT